MKNALNFSDQETLKLMDRKMADLGKKTSCTALLEVEEALEVIEKLGIDKVNVAKTSQVDAQTKLDQCTAAFVKKAL